MVINDPKLKYKNITGINNPKKILVHHALYNNCSIQDVHKWHLDNGWCGFGYNYFIRRDGTIWKGRPEDKPGAHCKENSMNVNSISICLEGCYESYIPKGSSVDLGQKDGITSKQLESLAWLCDNIIGRYKAIDITDIEPHRKYAKYKKCPGDYWDFNMLIDAIKSKYVVKEAKKYVKVEDWKLKEVEKAVKYGYIDNDNWKNKIDENIPVWAVLEMINDVYEKLSKK